VAIPPGALITAILVVNNLRDIPTDTAAGKRTLAVVLGKRRTQAEFGALLGVAYAVPVMLLLASIAGWSTRGATSLLTLLVLLPLLTLPLSRPLLATVRDFGEPRELNLVLKGTARLALWHGLLFAAGLAFLGAASGGSG
jgi:1,4-dihydroxy-2-naphthoate octaprenyltransferase